MFGLILSPLQKLLGILVLIVGLIGVGYYKGHTNTQVKFDAFKSEVAKTAAEQKAKTEATNTRRAQLAKDKQHAFKSNLDLVRKHYDGLLSDGTGTVPGLPEASQGINGAPSYHVLAGQCAETTLQLVTLQDYIKEAE